MTPSPHELGIIAGNKVIVKSEFLPKDNNPREVFTVIEAPVPPYFGHFILKGNSTGKEIKTYSHQDSLTEKIK